MRTVYKQNSNHKGEEGAEGKGKEGFFSKTLFACEPLVRCAFAVKKS
jgi:hypothetical protein